MQLHSQSKYQCLHFKLRLEDTSSKHPVRSKSEEAIRVTYLKYHWQLLHRALLAWRLRVGTHESPPTVYHIRVHNYNHKYLQHGDPTLTATVTAMVACQNLNPDNNLNDVHMGPLGSTMTPHAMSCMVAACTAEQPTTPNAGIGGS